MQEVACEKPGTCNIDQRSFKAYLSRWMAVTTQWAPFTYPDLLGKIRLSAQAAARTCNGGASATLCGIKWWAPAWDGSTGVGEQMSALSVIQNSLVGTSAPPVTYKAGTSKGDPSAGTGKDPNRILEPKPVTTKDRIGAGVFTGCLCVIVILTTWTMLL
jgi:mannan endo-1,6-alpha-mannosidase